MMSPNGVITIFFLLGIFVSSLPPLQATPFNHLGCFKDSWKSRALPDYLGKFHKILAVKKCADLAKKRGYTTFSVQDGGLCFTGVSADHTYNRYGRATSCRGGVGGSWANDVYQFPLYVLLKKLRDNYTNLRATTNNQGRRLNNLQRHYQSLSYKVRSLQTRLSALDRRVKRAHVVCYNRRTSWQDHALAPIVYLDRQDVACPHGQFLARFHLTRKDGNTRSPVRYMYRCCKFVL